MIKQVLSTVFACSILIVSGQNLHKTKQHSGYLKLGSDKPVLKSSRLKSAFSSKERLDSILYVYDQGLVAFGKEDYIYDSEGRNTIASFRERVTGSDEWLLTYQEVYAYDDLDRITIEEYGELNGEGIFRTTQRITYTYTVTNKLETVIDESFSSSTNNMLNHYKKVYEYDSDVLIALQEYYWDDQINNWKYTGKTDFTCNQQGLVITELKTDYDLNMDGVITSLDWEKNTKNYDLSNNLIKNERLVWNTIKNDWEAIREYDYTFNASNQQLTEKYYSVESETGQKTLLWDDGWIYDANGNTTDYIFREKEESSGKWYVDKTIYGYNLSVLANSYYMPDIEGVNVVNKLTGFNVFIFDENQWISDVTGHCYYSDDIYAGMTGNDFNIQFIQTNNVIQCIWENNSDAVTLKVFDMTGKLASQHQIRNGSIINLGNLKKGVYVCQILNFDILATSKIIIR